MSELVKAKLKASTIHLAISGVIFLGILYLILVEWYPGAFFNAEGGWKGISLMAAVDLVLGPSLTLIIYNHTKARKEIILDLSLIAIVQISALIWGGMQVYSERPVALVMWEGTFYTVTEDYFASQNIALEDLATFSAEKPMIIYAESDHSVEQLEEIMKLNEEKIPPYAQVHLYKPVKDSMASMLPHELPYDLYSDYLGKKVSPSEHHVFMGKAKNRNLLVYLDSNAKLVEIK